MAEIKDTDYVIWDIFNKTVLTYEDTTNHVILFESLAHCLQYLVVNQLPIRVMELDDDWLQKIQDQ